MPPLSIFLLGKKKEEKIVTKKEKRNRWIGGIIILVLIVIVLSQIDFKGVQPLAISGDSSFTPIFCNDYEFTCCGETSEFVSTIPVTDESPTSCPSWVTKCVLKNCNVQSGDECLTGTSGCGLDSLLLQKRWKCDDERTVVGGEIIAPNGFVWVQDSLFPRKNIQGQVTIEAFRNRLAFCGKAACDAGVTGIEISGADQCKFNPENNKIYSTSQQLINAVSWTVPSKNCVLSFQRGNRFICGYKEEACISNNDCGGHIYGNQECFGRTLQTYGCVNFGQTVPLERDRLPTDIGFGESSQESVFGKRCEITNAVQVQCCGDNDCGTNQFCEVGTWQCKEQVQCNQNVDCGVSVQCDSFTKKLKTPICRSGQCGFNEESVGCCRDSDCPSDNFCNADKECEERLVTCQTCPNECCDNECELSGGYFDRPCPEDKPFCVDNICKTEFEPDADEICESCDKFAINKLIGKVFKSQACKPKSVLGITTQTNTICFLSYIKLFLIPIVLIFVTLFGFNFFQTSKQLKIKNKGIAFLLSLIIGGLLAYLTFILFFIGIILSSVILIVMIVLKAIF